MSDCQTCNGKGWIKDMSGGPCDPEGGRKSACPECKPTLKVKLARQLAARGLSDGKAGHSPSLLSGPYMKGYRAGRKEIGRALPDPDTRLQQFYDMLLKREMDLAAAISDSSLDQILRDSAGVAFSHINDMRQQFSDLFGIRRPGE